MRISLALMALSAVAVAAPVPKDKVKDAEAIVGRWKLVDVQLGTDGEKARADDTGWMTAVYEFRKDGTYTSTEKGSKPVDGKYTLDPSDSPKSLDLFVNEAKLLLGYEIDGDTLKVCVGRGTDAKRPAELKANAKTATHVWVFERIKEKSSNEPRPPGSGD